MLDEALERLAVLDARQAGATHSGFDLFYLLQNPAPLADGEVGGLSGHQTYILIDDTSTTPARHG